MPNLHNWYKSAERKISQKNPEYMLNYSFPCSCSINLSSFRLIIKQQWTIEEISIFSNSSHLEWRVGLSDTILKGTHPRTIPARFGLIWFRGFWGEDLNVKVYDVWRTPSDGKNSHGLWPDELKMKTKVLQYIHSEKTYTRQCFFKWSTEIWETKNSYTMVVKQKDGVENIACELDMG